MDNYNIEYIKGKDSQANQLIFSGELTFNYIQYIKDETSELVNAEEPLSVIVRDADILDLSFIQLLISLKHTNSQNTIKLEVNTEMQDLINIAGFQDVLV